MTPRERFEAIVNFEPYDRLPLVEWAIWWDETIERWHAEGLDPSLRDRYALYEHFGLEQYKQTWVQGILPACPQPLTHGAPRMESTMAAYESIRPHILPEFKPSAAWCRWAEEQARGDAVLWFTVDGFFWFARTLLGIEPHLYAFYDAPELLHRINEDLAQWMLQVIERLCEVATPDFMTFAEDMSYNNGPMVSRKTYDEFMHPYYEQVVPELRRRGIVPVVDSDGDITIAAPWFEASGIKGVLPIERQAGCDIGRLRKDHPDMLWIGHFDKMTMPAGEAAMRAEFERLLPIAAQGGFIISVDHQTPPGVSLEHYRLFLRLFEEYATKAGAMSREQLHSTHMQSGGLQHHET
jgi:hypothetical protein